MVKVPNTSLDWAEGEELPNCCVWFNDFDTLHKQLASVVRSWITDKIPPVLEEESKKVLSKFSYEDTEREFLSYLHGVLDKRKGEMEELLTQVKKQENE
jgi:hypothetical protein